jgi:hypothetical protein
VYSWTNWYKNLKTFAPYYSKSLPPADFNSPFSVVLGLEISTATAESKRGLGFVFIISLITFERSIVLSLTVILLIYI